MMSSLNGAFSGHPTGVLFLLLILPSLGTGATNFNISSSGDTHTFNLLFNIRRNANNSSNNNINYNGYAVTGSAESSAVWTITR